MAYSLSPVATVNNSRPAVGDDFWGSVVSTITLAHHIPDVAFENIELFSHLEIIYLFHKVDESNVVFAGHPRENPDYPEMGIFAQRKKDRPNRIGLCTVELLEHSGRTITVRNLDAIDGTPVLDIKPVMKEFQVTGPTRQPEWVSQLMAQYWL